MVLRVFGHVSNPWRAPNHISELVHERSWDTKHNLKPDHVGNWPGVGVDRYMAATEKTRRLRALDLAPHNGIPSLERMSIRHGSYVQNWYPEVLRYYKRPRGTRAQIMDALVGDPPWPKQPGPYTSRESWWGNDPNCYFIPENSVAARKVRERRPNVPYRFGPPIPRT